MRMIVRAISSIDISRGLPMFTGSFSPDSISADDAVDEIGNVGEAARLSAVAEHGDVFVPQRLTDEGRHGAAVVEPHARAVGVEDSHDLRVDPVVPVIGHRHRFGKPLGLVVYAARPYRIDVAPVRLPLRMFERVAVDLRGRGDDEARSLGFGESERLVRAQGADLERLNRQLQIVDRTCRAGPVEHVVHRSVEIEILGHVHLDERELAIGQVGDVRDVASNEIVDADDGVAAIEKRFGEVRADEAGHPGNDDTCAVGHEETLQRTPRVSHAGSGGPRTAGSVGVPVEETLDQREPQNLEVEAHRPVLDVVEVVFDPLFD